MVCVLVHECMYVCGYVHVECELYVPACWVGLMP